MATKIFLLIFATFLIVQTSLAENKINREQQLTERIIEFYTQMIRQSIASISKAYEPIINEAENNKDATTDKNYTLKAAKLKEVLQRITDTPLTKRDQNNLFLDITLKEDAFNRYVRRNESLTEQYVKVRKVLEDIENAQLQFIEKFTEQAVTEIKKYWNDLTPTERQEQQKLRDDINKIENAKDASGKLDILDKIYDLRTEFRERYPEEFYN